MLGYTKDPEQGVNINAVKMSTGEADAIKTNTPAGEAAFSSYYTCSLKDMGSCNIAATRFGLPLWEVSSQRTMAQELLEGTQLGKDIIKSAANAVGELLKMVTDEATMEQGSILCEESTHNE